MSDMLRLEIDPPFRLQLLLPQAIATSFPPVLRGFDQHWRNRLMVLEPVGPVGEGKGRVVACLTVEAA